MNWLATIVVPLWGNWPRAISQPLKRLATIVVPLWGIWLRVVPQPERGADAVGI